MFKKCATGFLLLTALLGMGCGGGGGCEFMSIANFTIDSAGLKPTSQSSFRIFSLMPSSTPPSSTSPTAAWLDTFSFFPRAYAQPYCESQYIEAIVSIDVRSSADFDSAHPAGTLLDDLIEIDGRSLEARLPIRGSGNQGLLKYETVALYLNTIPSSNFRHTFYLEITLNSGVVIKVTSPELDLKPLI